MRCVYFIQGVQGGPVKIGWTAQPVNRRLAAIQSHSPVPLRVIAVLPGGRDREHAIHREFSSSRLHGEWFAPSDAMAWYLNVHKNNATHVLKDAFSDFLDRWHDA